MTTRRHQQKQQAQKHQPPAPARSTRATRSSASIEIPTPTTIATSAVERVDRKRPRSAVAAAAAAASVAPVAPAPPAPTADEDASPALVQRRSTRPSTALVTRAAQGLRASAPAPLASTTPASNSSSATTPSRAPSREPRAPARASAPAPKRPRTSAPSPPPAAPTKQPQRSQRSQQSQPQQSQQPRQPRQGREATASAASVAPRPRARAPPPDENDDYCHVCGHEGTLALCSTCVQAYHPYCLRSAFGGEVPDELDDDFTCESVGQSCTSRHVPRLLTDPPLADATFRFTSKPKLIGGRKHYTSAERTGDTYTIGTFVSIDTIAEDAEEDGDDGDGDTCKESFGEILDMWMDAKEGPMCTVRWFLAPEETALGRLPHHHTHELFATADTDKISLDAVQSWISIVSYNEFLERERHDALGDCVYFCRMRYSTTLGEFRSIVDDQEDVHSLHATRSTRTGASDTSKPSSSSTASASCASAAPAPPRASVYSRAAAQLQLSAAPARLPCREDERKQVLSFLENALRSGGSSSALYIAGVPGTGKTATVHQVVRELHEAAAATAATSTSATNTAGARISPFRFVEINGMKLPDPQQAYTVIWQALRGQHAAPARASLLLDQYFRTNHRTAEHQRPCILLIDEIDYILTKKQTVLYNIFDWLARPEAHLIIIAISNTLDLPDLLAPRIHSRLGLTRVHFLPYQQQQIQTIVHDRMRELNVFDKHAVELCARKIASVSGDVRRALQICRRAAEICEEDVARQASTSKEQGDKAATATASAADANKAPVIVSMRHIERAIADLQSSNMIQFVRQCTTFEKALLCALVLECKTTGVEEAQLNAVNDRCIRMCTLKGFQPVPTHHQMNQVCLRLAIVRVLALDQSPAFAASSIGLANVRLTMLVDDVRFALQEDETWSALL